MKDMMERRINSKFLIFFLFAFLFLASVERVRSDTIIYDYYYRYYAKYRWRGDQFKERRHNSLMNNLKKESFRINSLNRRLDSLRSRSFLEDQLRQAKEVAHELWEEEKDFVLDYPEEMAEWDSLKQVQVESSEAESKTITYGPKKNTVKVNPVLWLYIQTSIVNAVSQIEEKNQIPTLNIWRQHNRQKIAEEVNLWLRKQNQETKTRWQRLSRNEFNETPLPYRKRVITVGSWRDKETQNILSKKTNLADAFECYYESKGFFGFFNGATFSSKFDECYDCRCETNL